MNAELFDDIIKNASFELELFYDMKPGYYDFSGNHNKQFGYNRQLTSFI